MSTHAPLPQSIGYGIVVGVGALFAILMVGSTFALKRYQKEKMTSEEFGTAGRSVGSGLIACAVVSSWTWAATLLVSSTKAYTYGISGPLWYGGGAVVQIFLFAALAIEVKRKAPGCHTYLEIVMERYGKWAHAVFMFFALATNILVTAMLLAGGSATVKSLTGMNEFASLFLIPLGVTVYTLAGGLKATFISDYLHTVILLVIILVFAFNTYATNSFLGSPGRVYDLLVEAGKKWPVEGNEHGSYLTMKSHSGGIFLVINLAGNFGTVFLDQGYWNKAIAASPAAALPGYALGGVAWFAIPFTCATTMGLVARVLEHTHYWPQYPNVMSDDDVSAGLALPYAAVALMGRNGGAAALLMIFMAVTSATSGEMVAVSTIWTYDVYKRYINPNATGKQLIMMTHLSVVVFILAMIGFSIGLHYGGVFMGYLYTLMGVIISSAVIPATLTLYWSGMNRLSAIVAPVLGMALGITAMVATTAGLFDSKFTVDTTGSDYPMLAGNVVSLCSPLVIIPITQLIGGHAHFNWEKLQDLHPDVEDSSSDSEIVDQTSGSKAAPSLSPQAVELEQELETAHEARWIKEEAMLNRYALVAQIAVVFITLVFIILWPMPMYGSGYLFSKPFYTGWIVVGIIWIWLSLLIVGALPLWQGRHSIYNSIRGMYWDVSGQSNKLYEFQHDHPEELHTVLSPVLSPITAVSRQRHEPLQKKD